MANECSSNFVRSRGSEKSVVEVERGLGRVRPALTGSTMFERYAGAGHVPWKTDRVHNAAQFELDAPAYW